MFRILGKVVFCVETLMAFFGVLRQDVREYHCTSPTRVFTISLTNREVRGNVTYRLFHVACSGLPPREMHHMQFSNWPCRVPEFLEFVEEVQRCRARCNSKLAPTVTHSGNGIGSIGVLALFEIMTEKVRAGLIPDAKEILLHLRSQKPGLVVNIKQFSFALKAAVEYTQQLAPPKYEG
eukprot:m.1619310 g.1619310  ORF g.1619310 m.1619310 type:complete len:179 (+) comp25381_c0_seq1:9852-10388(+)